MPYVVNTDSIDHLLCRCGTQHKPISIINHKFIRQSVIYTLGGWGTSHPAKMDIQFLSHLIFKLFTKVVSARPSIFSGFCVCVYVTMCHMIEETFSHPYIWRNPPKKWFFFFFFFFLGGGGETIQNCQHFKTLGRYRRIQTGTPPPPQYNDNHDKKNPVKWSNQSLNYDQTHLWKPITRI